MNLHWIQCLSQSLPMPSSPPTAPAVCVVDQKQAELQVAELLQEKDIQLLRQEQSHSERWYLLEISDTKSKIEQPKDMMGVGTYTSRITKTRKLSESNLTSL